MNRQTRPELSMSENYPDGGKRVTDLERLVGLAGAAGIFRAGLVRLLELDLVNHQTLYNILDEVSLKQGEHDSLVSRLVENSDLVLDENNAAFAKSIEFHRAMDIISNTRRGF